MFKVAKNGVSTIFYEIFQKNEQNIYHLRNKTEFNISLVKTVYNRLDSLFYIGSKVWNMLPVECNELESSFVFESKIVVWNPNSCPNLQKLHL